MTKRMSNYDIMKKRMQPEFLKYDQSAMTKKFNLKNDDDYIYITFFGREYRIDRKSGAVFCGEREADFNVTMTIYDILCYSKEGCVPSGELVGTNSLSTLHSGSVTLGSGEGIRLARIFSGREEAFARACRKLGGEVWGKGDVSYAMPVFDGIRFAISYWEADDEFPSSLNMFIDRNILQYMRFETMCFATGHFIERIKEEMERP